MSESQATVALHRRQIGHARGGIPIHAFFLASASGVRLGLAEYGARVISIDAPDPRGEVARIFDGRGPGTDGEIESVTELEAASAFGATHCALAGAHQDGPAHSVWWGAALGDGVRFHYQSPAGEDGREAALDCTVEFRLDARGSLSVKHEVRVSKDQTTAAVDLVTPLAFDLANPRAPEPPQHELRISSNEIAELDAQGEATGHLLRDSHASRDAGVHRSLFARENEDLAPVDYVLWPGRNKCAASASLCNKQSGRRVEIETDRPVLRFEMAGRREDRLPAIGLTPRNFPCADRHSHFPTARVATEVSWTTHYHFGLEA